MKREEALKQLQTASTVNEKFEVAYNILKHSPPISQDKMLLLYAYYKQAVFGDYREIKSDNDFSNYIQTFKNNAWGQVRGLSSDKAKQEYINYTIQLIKDEYPK
ncbi:MAG: acyl-CoA-binding protein [Bacteroidota bacterium]